MSEVIRPSGATDRSLGDLRGTVTDRVRRRLELLRGWNVQGVPAAYLDKLPTSLREVAKWEARELGIWPIASPNDFTTRHRTWGKSVLEIETLISQIAERYIRKPGRRSNNVAGTSSTEVRILLRQLEDAASRWHAEREAAAAAREKCVSAEGRVARLLRELAQKDALISELRKRIVSLEALRSIR